MTDSISTAPWRDKNGTTRNLATDSTTIDSDPALIEVCKLAFGDEGQLTLASAINPLPMVRV